MNLRRTVQRTVRWGGRVLLVIATLVLLAIVFRAPVPIGEALVLFPPERPPLSAWRRPGVETFVVAAADGTPLRGWILPGRAGAPWILMSYGNAGSVQNMAALARWFPARLGLTTVLWDYRGYGFSGGHVNALATRDDALRVYDAMRARSGGAPFVYGLSYGSTVAVHLAASRPVRALVLHAPPSSATAEFEAVRDRYVAWPFNRLRPVPTRAVAIAMDTAREIHAVRAPLLVLHGDADTLIPIRQGRAVAAAASSADKRFVVVHGADHGDVRYGGTPAGEAIAVFLTGR